VAERNQEDAQTRGVLLAAARELLGEDANFSLKTLLIKTGVSRAQFRRCFADKEQLLAALTGEEVKGLGEIMQVAQRVPQAISMAVGSDVAPVSPSEAAPHNPAASAPPTDAWLERRLRVFERALAGLEKRQEKSEEALTLQLTLIREQLDTLKFQEMRVELSPMPEAHAPMPETIFHPVAMPRAAPAPAPEPELAAPAPEEIAPALLQLAALAPAGPSLAEIETTELPAATQAFAEEIAAPEPTAAVAEKEISDFIAHARRVAQNAALAEQAPPQRPWNMRWLAWGGAVLIVLLVCAGVLIANGALGGTAGAAPVRAASGVSHRHVAQNGIARVIALADSGDATAQTMLAIDYLKGNGVAGDDAAAKRWSLAAASQGQPVAEYLLGTLYLEGNKDEGAAVRWFAAAAGQGNVKAMHNLAIAYAEGLGVDKDPAQAVQWFERAAQQGYRDSEFDLAVLYERGLGVPQSASAALKWYLIAAARGDAPSAARAAFLKEQLNPLETKVAAQEAASFVPLSSGSFANETPTL
jgi:TPR repeat protein